MEPVEEVKTLVQIAAALILLLVLTVGLSFIDMGRFNFPVAILIAIGKATLVILFFMEVRHSRSAIKVAATAGTLWLALLIIGSVLDVITRIPLVH